MILASHATSLPVETNSISLDSDLKDAWGLPALCMTYRDHSDDLSTIRFLRDRAQEIVTKAKAAKIGRRQCRNRRLPSICWEPAAWGTIRNRPWSIRTIVRMTFPISLSATEAAVLRRATDNPP